MQVDSLLCARLGAFVAAQRELKDTRRRFDRAGHEYDVAREKHLSLRRSAAPEEVRDDESEPGLTGSFLWYRPGSASAGFG